MQAPAPRMLAGSTLFTGDIWAARRTQSAPLLRANGDYY